MRAKRIVNTYAAAGSVEQLFSFDLKQLDAAGFAAQLSDPYLPRGQRLCIALPC